MLFSFTSFESHRRESRVFVSERMLHALDHFRYICRWYELSDNWKRQSEDNTMSSWSLIIYVSIVVYGRGQITNCICYDKNALRLELSLSPCTIMCPLMTIYLPFSPFEPFSKSRIIVHSLGRSDRRIVRDNNRQILNANAFQHAILQFKLRRNRVLLVECSFFIIRIRKRMFLPLYISLFVHYFIFFI